MTSAGRAIGALMSAEGVADPYPIYRAVRELGPVAPITPSWFVVSTYAEVREVLHSAAYSKNRYLNVGEEQRAIRRAHRSIQLFDESVLLQDASDHNRVRRLLSTAFSPKRVAAMERQIQQIADRLLDDLAELNASEGAVDFMEEFAVRLPLTVMCDLLGVPQEDWRRFRPLIEVLTTASEMTVDGPQLVAADAAAEALDEYFEALIDVRRAEPRDDLISNLLGETGIVGGQMGPGELLANLELLLVAGFGNTADLLGNALGILFEYPEIREGVISGRYTYEGFIEEVLRFDPPTQHLIRTAGAPDLTLAGLPIPVGAELVLLVGSANRDPLRFPDPDVFDPARTSNHPLSFGGGAHYCVAASLARLEGVTAIRQLLGRYPYVASSGRSVRADRHGLRGFRELPIILDRKLQGPRAE